MVVLQMTNETIELSFRLSLYLKQAVDLSVCYRGHGLLVRLCLYCVCLIIDTVDNSRRRQAKLSAPVP